MTRYVGEKKKMASLVKLIGNGRHILKVKSHLGLASLSEIIGPQSTEYHQGSLLEMWNPSPCPTATKTESAKDR